MGTSVTLRPWLTLLLCLGLMLPVLPTPAVAQEPAGLTGHVTWRNGGATGASQEDFHRISVIPVGQTEPVKQLLVDSAPPATRDGFVWEITGVAPGDYHLRIEVLPSRDDAPFERWYPNAASRSHALVLSVPSDGCHDLDFDVSGRPDTSTPVPTGPCGLGEAGSGRQPFTATLYMPQDMVFGCIILNELGSHGRREHLGCEEVPEGADAVTFDTTVPEGSWRALVVFFDRGMMQVDRHLVHADGSFVEHVVNGPVHLELDLPMASMTIEMALAPRPDGAMADPEEALCLTVKPVDEAEPLFTSHAVACARATAGTTEPERVTLHGLPPVPMAVRLGPGSVGSGYTTPGVKHLHGGLDARPRSEGAPLVGGQTLDLGSHVVTTSGEVQGTLFTHAVVAPILTFVDAATGRDVWQVDMMSESSGNWIIDGRWLAKENAPGDYRIRIDHRVMDEGEDGWLRPRIVLTRWWPNASSIDGAGTVTLPADGCRGLAIDVRPDAYDWPGHHGVCGTRPPGPRPPSTADPDYVVPLSIKGACPGRERFEGTFADVAGAHAAASDCGGMWDLVRGVGGRDYGPGRQMTRGQMASILVGVLAGTRFRTEGPFTNAFVDDNGIVHEHAINVLAHYRIVEGTGDRFDPGGSITRAQLASMLQRLWTLIVEAPPPPSNEDFSDNSGVHADAVRRMAGLGVVTGFSDGTYRGHLTMTRGQMASVVMRMVSLLLDRGRLGPR